MAWIYLVESGESQSPLENGSDQSPIVKSIPIVKECCLVEWPIETSCQPLFGMILKHLNPNILKEELISSTEASHARTSALQDLERVWQESEADYFSRSCAWPKKSSQSSYSLRTWPQSPVAVGLELLERLPKWGMIVDGVLYPLLPLERPIKEIDGSCLPTPRAREGGPIPPDTNYRQNQRSYNHRTGKHVQITLRRAVQMYPTPTRRNTPDCPCERRRVTPQLESVVNMELSTNGKKLCPKFVELLMGYPKEWTVLGALGNAVVPNPGERSVQNLNGAKMKKRWKICDKDGHDRECSFSHIEAKVCGGRGWETDSGYKGYGLSYEMCEYICEILNKYGDPDES